MLKIINPKRYKDETIFEKHWTVINEKLLNEGIEIDKVGQARIVEKAWTIFEVKRRYMKVKEHIHRIGFIQRSFFTVTLNGCMKIIFMQFSK
jgi:hypothetical protein